VAGGPSPRSRGALPFRTKLWFGVGQIAEGVKSRAFETFLFFYYEQVLGRGAGLSAAALALAVLRNASVAPVLNEVSAGARSGHHRRLRITMTGRSVFRCSRALPAAS
jgi:Na+/melibiose symporter-like transporter